MKNIVLLVIMAITIISCNKKSNLYIDAYYKYNNNNRKGVNLGNTILSIDKKDVFYSNLFPSWQAYNDQLYKEKTTTLEELCGFKNCVEIMTLDSIVMSIRDTFEHQVIFKAITNSNNYKIKNLKKSLINKCYENDQTILCFKKNDKLQINDTEFRWELRTLENEIFLIYGDYEVITLHLLEIKDQELIFKNYSIFDTVIKLSQIE